MWSIRTLDDSALVNSDLNFFGPSQFGPCPLVNLDPTGQFGPFFIFLLPNSDLFFFFLANSDLFLWLIRTLSYESVIINVVTDPL